MRKIEVGRRRLGVDLKGGTGGGVASARRPISDSPLAVCHLDSTWDSESLRHRISSIPEIVGAVYGDDWLAAGL